MTSTKKVEIPHKTGVGFYPEFHALWHLQALNVIEDLTTFKSQHWDNAAKNEPVRVVVMDTPVDWEHPNLEGAIDKGAMRDFASSDSPELLATQGKSGTFTANETAATIYAAHGTAVAGLIGARPAEIELQVPGKVGPFDTEPSKEFTKDLILPYAGINPFCTIIPVSLTAAPDVDMVMAALRYVLSLKPQIVVIAAAWDDANRALKNMQSFDEAEGKWSDVECLLTTICQTSLVLCAAGNSGPSEMAYPACLANKIPNLIAVTACDASGNPLTYAFDSANAPGVIATLSTQGTRFDHEEQMLNPWDEVDDYLKRPCAKVGFPAQRIISLDPRGPRGYNPSIYRYTPTTKGPHLEIASLYAEFSGTSAATAIAAGLISLAMQIKNSANIGHGINQGVAHNKVFNINAALSLFSEQP